MDTTEANNSKKAKIHHDEDTSSEEEQAVIFGYCTRCKGYGQEGTECVTLQCCKDPKGASKYNKEYVDCNCCGGIYTELWLLHEFTGVTMNEFRNRI